MLKYSTYGCNCHFLVGDRPMSKPGYGQPIDELDQVCKDYKLGSKISLLVHYRVVFSKLSLTYMSKFENYLFYRNVTYLIQELRVLKKAFRLRTKSRKWKCKIYNKLSKLGKLLVLYWMTNHTPTVFPILVYFSNFILMNRKSNVWTAQLINMEILAYPNLFNTTSISTRTGSRA